MTGSQTIKFGISETRSSKEQQLLLSPNPQSNSSHSIWTNSYQSDIGKQGARPQTVGPFGIFSPSLPWVAQRHLPKEGKWHLFFFFLMCLHAGGCDLCSLLVEWMLTLPAGSKWRFLIETHTSVYNRGVGKSKPESLSWSYLMSTQHGWAFYKWSSISLRLFCKQILQTKTFQLLCTWHGFSIPALLANGNYKAEYRILPGFLFLGKTENNIGNVRTVVKINKQTKEQKQQPCNDVVCDMT